MPPRVPHEKPLTEEMLKEILNNIPKDEEDRPLGGKRSRAGEYGQALLTRLKDWQITVNDGIKNDKAFTLIYFCICVIVFIYILQIWLPADLELAKSIIELMKAVIFSASGYIFAKKM